MCVDALNALLDEWDNNRHEARAKLDAEALAHRRLVLALPEFLKSVQADLEIPFKIFNKRVGYANAFTLSVPDGGVLSAVKDSYPGATMHVGVISELASLSVKGETPEGEFTGMYVMRMRDMQIHLEHRLSKKRAYVTLEGIKTDVVLPFLESVLRSIT